jgi:hypothetical protein
MRAAHVRFTPDSDRKSEFPHKVMSAFGGKADMAFCEISLSRSLLGVKRTLSIALHMSAFDPKRTSFPLAVFGCLAFPQRAI